MTEPIKPYVVNFNADPIPDRAAVDRSASRPGPDNGVADRAGYTKVHLDGRGMLKIDWRAGKARGDGKVPLYAETAEVTFHLTDYVVAISSDYPEQSCAFEATLRHELSAHIKRPIDLFKARREDMVLRLNRIPLPTKDHPRWIRDVEFDPVSDGLGEQVRQEIAAVRQELVSALKTDRAVQDDAQHYDVVYKTCKPADWAARKH